MIRMEDVPVLPSAGKKMGKPLPLPVITAIMQPEIWWKVLIMPEM